MSEPDAPASSADQSGAGSVPAALPARPARPERPERPRWQRWAIGLGVAALLLAGAALAGLQLATRQLEASLREALGPRATLRAVELGLTGVRVRGLEIAAGPDWPDEHELSAEEVWLRPRLSSLWQDRWHIDRIEIRQASISLMRTRDGRLRVLPALLERSATAAPAGPSRSEPPAKAPNAPTAPAARSGRADAPAPAGPRVRVAEVVLKDVAVDFYDASLRQGLHQLRLQDLQAGLGPLDWPALDSRTEVKLQALLKGPRRDGQLTVKGHVNFASREADVQARAAGVDLVALQPYLLKVNEGGVRRGVLDLDLHAQVQGQRLKAPGKLVLTGLQLGPAPGLLGTFGGLPRQAVLAAMERQGRIELKFTLEGRLDDPNFSLNDNLSARIAGGLAEAMGVSLGGVVEGVGGLVKGLFGR